MASLLDWLGHQAQGIAAQVNPWDNGATYASVQNANTRQYKRQQPQQPQQPVRPPQKPNQQPKDFVTQGLKFTSPVALMGLNTANLIGSGFNQAEATKRNAEFLNTIGVKKPLAKDLSNSIITPEKTGQFLFNNTAKLINTADTGVMQPLALAASGRSPNEIQDYMNRNLYSNKGGLLNAGTFFPSQKAFNKATSNPLEFGKQFTAAGVGTAAEVAPMVRGASLAAKPGLSTAQKVVRSGIEGAGYGGAGSAANQYLETGKINPGDVAIGAGAGAVLGTAATALPGVVKGSRDVANQAAKVANEARPSVIAAQHPSVLGFDDQYSQLAKAFDNTPDPIARKQISQAMAENRQQRLATQRQVQRQITQGGFIAGPLAGDFSKAQKAGLVFEGVDGKPRFEVDDSGAKIKQFKPELYPGSNVSYSTVGDILDHPALLSNYPELANIDVAFIPNAKTQGTFSNRGIELSDGLLRNPEGLKSTLLHEIQHAVQGKEKFAGGGTGVRANDASYKNLAGEAEARAVQARMDMPMSERYVMPDNALFHGSISQDMRGGSTGLHLGTQKAAQEALEARIGVRADGKLWDGSSSYYDTKLAGSKTLEKLQKEQPYRGSAGFRYGAVVDGKRVDFPENDFYIKDHPELLDQLKYADGTMPDLKKVKPSINAFELTGEMTNTRSNPMEDSKANSRMSVMKKRGQARRGYYYENTAEDSGSISAVVPDGSFVKPANPRSTFYDSLDVPKKDLIVRNGDGKAMSIEPKDPLAALKQTAPVLPKRKAVETATQPQPQVPAHVPPQAVAQAEPGGSVLKPQNEVGFANPQKTSRYASKTIPSSEFVGEKVATQTKQNAPTYTPETERGRYSQTLRSADDMGFDNFENDVLTRLESKHIDSQTVADSQAVAQRLEAKGDEASLRRAADIYDKVSEHLTRAGQTVQAAAIMSRRTPEGIKYQALKDLRNNGVEITPEIQTKINTQIKAIAQTQPQTEARVKAVTKLAQDVDKLIPNTMLGNAVSVWKAGLLSGVKTTQGNVISNATFGALSRASDPVTLAADTAMSFFTGKMTKGGTLRGIGSGTKEGIQKGYDTLKTGIDTRTATDKYELHKGINFKNPTVQKIVGNPAQKVFDFMGAQDQPFYFAQLKNSMYDLAKADGINRGLKGNALKKFMDDTVANPPEAMLQRATDEANKAVLAYDTVAYKAIQAAKQGIDRAPMPKIWKDTAAAVVDVLAPFTRVPTAFLSRAIDFTPLGVPKEALTQISNKTFDQRALSQAIGEGVTGTGLIVLGAALANNGQISGDYPSSPKEQARWKAEGIQPNSIKLGDKWFSLNYLGPVGMLFGAGKKFVDAGKEGSDALGATAAAIGGFGQTLLGQSFLQGLSGFMDAAKDPKRYMESFVNSQSGSLVPSIVNDFANLTDGYKRDVNNGFEAIMNRIPGARQMLNEKQDVYGNKLKQSPAESLLALRPSGNERNSSIDEVSRLSQVDPNNNDLQVTPTPIDKYLTVNGKRINLTDQQRYDLQNKVGQTTQKAWQNLIATDEYKKLSDTDKAQALNNLRTDVSSIVQRSYVEENGLAKYENSLTNRQKSLLQGDSTVTAYAKSGDETSVDISPNLNKQNKDILTKYSSSTDRDKWFNKENDAEYKYTLAKYENDKANGKLSTVEDIKAKKELRVLKVGSQYSKNVRDLYSLSKADLADYLSTQEKGVDKQKIAEDLLAYDRALYDSGAKSTLKFKYGIAGSGKGGGRKRSGGKGRKGGGKGSGKSTSVAAGKSLVSLTESLNKIRVPKTTGSKPPSGKITPPRLNKTNLKTYRVAKAKQSTRKGALA